MSDNGSDFGGPPPDSDDDAPPMSDDGSDDGAPPISDDEDSDAPPMSDDEEDPPLSDDDEGPPPDESSQGSPTPSDLDVFDSLSSGLKLGKDKSKSAAPAASSHTNKTAATKVTEPPTAGAAGPIRSSMVLPTPNTVSDPVGSSVSVASNNSSDNKHTLPSAALNTGGGADVNAGGEAAAGTVGVAAGPDYMAGPPKPLSYYRQIVLDMAAGGPTNIVPNRPMYDQCNFDQSVFKKVYGKFLADPDKLPAIGTKEGMKTYDQPLDTEIADEFEPLRMYVCADEEVIYLRLHHITPAVCADNDDQSVASEITADSTMGTKTHHKRSRLEGEGVGDILFDLRDMGVKEKTFISIVKEDKTAFRIRHKSCDLLIKVDSVSMLQQVLGAMPECVFESPPMYKIKKPVDAQAGRRPSPPPGAVQRKKYTSVEDILEGNDMDNSSACSGTTSSIKPPSMPPPPPGEDDDFFQPPSSLHGEGSMVSSMNNHGMGMGMGITGANSEEVFNYIRRRKELLDSHIRKPKYSVRHVTQLCNWLTGLAIWPRPICISNLHKEMCSGLLLAKLMQHLVPGTKFMHLNEKVLTKKTALQNLEQALGVVWRSKSVNNSRIGTAKDFFDGNTSKIAVTLQEIFEVYVRTPLFKTVLKILSWYDVTLKQYGLALPEDIFIEGELSGVWPSFQNGTALFCIFYHYFGPIAIGEGANIVRIDPLRVVFQPARISDFRSNVNYVFTLMKACKIPIIWDTEAWITFPDTESLLLQLSYIYEAFKNKGCCLAPASGTSAGVTAGPNGEMLVIGLIFADSRPINSRSFQRRHRTVLLGSGKDCLPMLPIDSSSFNGRYSSTEVPKGLISSNAKFIHTNVKLAPGKRAISERKGWNASNLVEHAETKLSGSATLSVLKDLNSTEMATNMKNLSLEKAMNMTLKSTKSKADTDQHRSKIERFKAQMEADQEQRQSKISTDIMQAMEGLERAMNDADRELELMEEELEHQYIDLENRVGTMNEVEYQSILEALDGEAKHLETEKCRLQEHFSLCLSSIRLQYQEESARINSVADEEARQLQELEAIRRATAQAARVKQQEQENQKNYFHGDAKQQKLILEKKWISETRPLSNKSHNYHLQKKQSASIMKAERVWEPPSVLRRKEKELQQSLLNANNPFIDSSSIQNGGGGMLSPRSPMRLNKQPNVTQKYDSSNMTSVVFNPAIADQEATTPAQVFNLFKEKLREETAAWYADSNASVATTSTRSSRRPSVRDIMSDIPSPKKKIPLMYHPTASSRKKITQNSHYLRPANLSSTVASFYASNAPTSPAKSPNSAYATSGVRKVGEKDKRNNAAAAAAASANLSNLPWDEIRSHEFLCMKYEDDRRRLVLQAEQKGAAAAAAAVAAEAATENIDVNIADVMVHPDHGHHPSAPVPTTQYTGSSSYVDPASRVFASAIPLSTATAAPNSYSPVKSSVPPLPSRHINGPNDPYANGTGIPGGDPVATAASPTAQSEEEIDFEVSRPNSTTSFMDSRPNTAASNQSARSDMDPSASAAGDQSMMSSDLDQSMRSEKSELDMLDEIEEGQYGEDDEIPPMVVNHHDVTEENVSKAIDVLSSKTDMMLMGRKPVLVTWCTNSVLATTEDINDIDEAEDGDVADYELTWYTADGKKGGCVSLLEIISINISPHDTVNIVVSDDENPNPKALQRSGGRSVVSIQCGSLQASLTFNKHLEVLRTVLL